MEKVKNKIKSEPHYKSSEWCKVGFLENNAHNEITNFWYSLERMCIDIRKNDADFPNYISLMQRINDEDTIKVKNKCWLNFKTMKGAYKIIVTQYTYAERLENELKFRKVST